MSSNGAQGDHISDNPSISADGRYVAFTSNSKNLVSGSTLWRDVFVHDRMTKATAQVSVSSSGAQGDGESSWSSISADGRFIAFTSQARNLVPGDTNVWGDVFVHDQQTKSTTRVSVSSNGAQGDQDSGTSTSPHISADGRHVVFASLASNLVVGDSNGTWDVFVHDRQTMTTTRVSVSSSGLEDVGHSISPSISADGRFVAFDSNADDFVPGDTNGYYDTFVHDRQTLTTTRVSVSSTGMQGNRPSHWNHSPVISADGRYVAFSSWASNLVPGDTNLCADVFLHDRQTNLTTRVNVDSNGAQGNQEAAPGGFALNGRLVTFWSLADNLVPGDDNARDDVFVHDRLTRETTRVSVNSSGVEGVDASINPRVTEDGRFVAFTSWAYNLVPGDTNRWSDVFVHERCALPPAAASNRLIGQSCKHSSHAAATFGPRFAGTVPYVGERFELAAAPLPTPPTTHGAVGLLGLGELTAPVDLSVTGLFLANCFLHVDFIVQVPLPRDRPDPRSASWPFFIPCDPRLIGLKFYAQAAVIDSANAHSWTLTNAYEGKIGSR